MYEEYERRIQRIADIIHKYRWFLVGAMTVIIGTLFVLFGIGIASSELKCRSVEYGNKPSPSASSTAGRVVYEYRLADGNSSWSEDVPWKAGKYEVRAISASILGIRHEIGRGRFEIKKKPLTIQPKTIETYHRVTQTELKPEVETTGLEYGDVVTDIRFDSLKIDYGDNFNASYTLRSYAVVHEDGSPAEDCYEIKTASGQIYDKRIPLVVAPKGKKVVYSGNPHEVLTCEEWTLVGGTLLDGHTGEFICDTRVTTFEKRRIYGRFIVRDENGDDVTHMYRVTLQEASLEFARRSIRIISGSAMKRYDGKPLRNENFKTRGDSLADGDTLIVRCTGQQTEVGVSANDMDVKIVSDTYGDVTDCYVIELSEGLLRVVRADGSMDSARKDSINLDRLGDRGRRGGEGGQGGGGEEIAIISFLGDRGKKYYFREETYEYYTGSSWGNTTESQWREPEINYRIGNILMENGNAVRQLTIRDCLLEHLVYPYFMTQDEEIGYDNEYYCTLCEPLSYSELLWMREYSDDEYYQYALEHYLDIDDDMRDLMLSLGEEAGIYLEDEITAEFINKVAFYIQHAATYDMEYADFPEGEDIVKYFLTVSKEGICQHFASAGVLMFRAYGIPARYTVGLVGIGKGSTWSKVTGDFGHAWVEIYVRGLGWIPVEVTGPDRTGRGLGGSSWMDDGGYQGGDEPGGEGKLDFMVAFETVYHVYNGKKIVIEAPDLSQLNSDLPEGYSLEVTLTTRMEAGPNVGSYTFDARAALFDETGKDVTREYNLMVIPPTLEITTRPIEITIYNRIGEKADGELSSDRWFISKGSLADGERIDISFDSSLGTEGRKSTNPTVRIYTEKGKDVTDNYQITYVDGNLEMKTGDENDD
ncbi:MAG: transglutaminase domain-containing protein [Lachnospiraceae bacterium]|nr:transglutaminase domain-containing protein [Lachnospiraceae bacterium]